MAAPRRAAGDHEMRNCPVRATAEPCYRATEIEMPSITQSLVLESACQTWVRHTACRRAEVGRVMRGIPETMRAAAIERFGGPELLELRTLPVPEVEESRHRTATRRPTWRSKQARRHRTFPCTPRPI